MAAPSSDINCPEIDREVLPYLRLYKNGDVQRLLGTVVTPPGLDPVTGVDSKDIIIVPETGMLARLYRPAAAVDPPRKLPLVVYFHGGAFVISSTADRVYHEFLNSFVAEAQCAVVSVDYRLVPEHSLQTVYDDSWAALEWVAAQSKYDDDNDGDKNRYETWLMQHVDFQKVFLVGDSAGANISHHMALKANNSNLSEKFKIVGIALIHPYFWGAQPIGAEINNPQRKSEVDNWWGFVCPSDKGNDDPSINPFAAGAPAIEGLAGEKAVVMVAEEDILRDRGRVYFENLAQSQWKGEVECFETKAKDHVFHIIDPGCVEAKAVVQRLGLFVNGN